MKADIIRQNQRGCKGEMGILMKKVVITGATSFIGIHLIHEWLLTGNCVIFAVIRPNSQKKGCIPIDNRIHVIECAMDSYETLNQQIKSADYFFHLAWEGARAPYRDDIEIQHNNYKFALKAMELSEDIGCQFFLGTGSQAEYGITSGLINEKYPCNPSTAYGREKLHAYIDLKKMSEKSGIKFIWTRIFSIYGKYDYPKTLIMTTLTKMHRNETIEMTAGKQLWDYLNVKDATRAMILLAESQCNSGVYNLASGEYRPLREFIVKIKEILRSKSVIKMGAIPYGTSGPVNLTPDVSKIKNSVGWIPEISFEAGINTLQKELF